MEKVARDENELDFMVYCVLYDGMKSAGIIPEALLEAVLGIAEVEIAGVEEVHGELRWCLGLKMVVGAGRK